MTRPQAFFTTCTTQATSGDPSNGYTTSVDGPITSRGHSATSVALWPFATNATDCPKTVSSTLTVSITALSAKGIIQQDTKAASSTAASLSLVSSAPLTKHIGSCLLRYHTKTAAWVDAPASSLTTSVGNIQHLPPHMEENWDAVAPTHHVAESHLCTQWPPSPSGGKSKDPAISTRDGQTTSQSQHVACQENDVSVQYAGQERLDPGDG